MNATFFVVVLDWSSLHFWEKFWYEFDATNVRLRICLAWLIGKPVPGTLSLASRFCDKNRTLRIIESFEFFLHDAFCLVEKAAKKVENCVTNFFIRLYGRLTFVIPEHFHITTGHECFNSDNICSLPLSFVLPFLSSLESTVSRTHYMYKAIHSFISFI